MSINFTVKKNVVAFVDEAVNRAGAYLFGFAKEPAAQPYTNYSILNKIVEPIFQARTAIERWNLSRERVQAALLLHNDYHATLILNESPIAQVSSKIFELAGRISDIDKMQKMKTSNYLIRWIFGIVGVAALSIGSYTSAPWLKTTGKIVLFLTAAFYGYTRFSHRNDQQKISELYGRVGILGEQIRYDLCSYDDEMKAQANSGERYQQYQPLFESFASKDYNPDQLKGKNLKGLMYQKVH